MQHLARAELPIAIVVADGDVGEDGAAAEAALIDRARSDPQAFSLLYRRYLEPVYRYCYHRLGSKEAAEDATSQVFAKVLTALSTFRSDRPFRSWLFVIAHNVVVDMHRARRPSESLDAAINLHDAAPSPEDAAIAAEGAQVVRDLLAGLSPDQARVVELRLAGLSEVEIARALGRKPGAIRAVQFRALVKLRAQLGIAIESKGAGDA